MNIISVNHENEQNLKHESSHKKVKFIFYDYFLIKPMVIFQLVHQKNLFHFFSPLVWYLLRIMLYDVLLSHSQSPLFTSVNMKITPLHWMPFFQFYHFMKIIYVNHENKQNLKQESSHKKAKFIFIKIVELNQWSFFKLVHQKNLFYLLHLFDTD